VFLIYHTNESRTLLHHTPWKYGPLCHLVSFLLGDHVCTTLFFQAVDKDPDDHLTFTINGSDGDVLNAFKVENRK